LSSEISTDLETIIKANVASEFNYSIYVYWIVDRPDFIRVTTSFAGDLSSQMRACIIELKITARQSFGDLFFYGRNCVKSSLDCAFVVLPRASFTTSPLMPGFLRHFISWLHDFTITWLLFTFVQYNSLFWRK